MKKFATHFTKKFRGNLNDEQKHKGKMDSECMTVALEFTWSLQFVLQQQIVSIWEDNEITRRSCGAARMCLLGTKLSWKLSQASTDGMSLTSLV